LSRLRARSAECRAPDSAVGPEDLEAMRAAAFHRAQVAVLPLDRLPEMERIVVTQICERLYGRRKP
jgi:hypothetical protein